MKNNEKQKLLDLIKNDDEFYSLDSIELKQIYEALTSNWNFSSTPPSFIEFLNTFPESEYFSKKYKNFLEKKYLQQNTMLRIIGYGGYEKHSDNSKRTKYLCECICGNKKTIRQNLPYSCDECEISNPLRKIKSRLIALKILEKKIGEKHNRLIIKAVSPQRSSSKKNMVLVECDCRQSEPFSVIYVSLIPQGKNKRINTKSCGCLERELALERKKKSAEKSIGLIKNHLRIDAMEGYHPVTKKQLVSASCLACNSSVIIRLNDWKTERQKSCGCLRFKGMERKSYNGRKHLFLEVLDDCDDRKVSSGRVVRFVRCKCHACGRTDYEVRLDNIINEQQVSCGCIENINRDNIPELLVNKNYAQRSSSTYLVSIKLDGKKYIKVGIAFNFLNRKSAAKRDGIPYLEILRKVELDRSKSWLLEQIILLKLKKFRMFNLAGLVSGGTEIFNNKIKRADIISIFDEEYKKIKDITFQRRLSDLNCHLPAIWSKGLFN